MPVLRLIGFERTPPLQAWPRSGGRRLVDDGCRRQREDFRGCLVRRLRASPLRESITVSVQLSRSISRAHRRHMQIGMRYQRAAELLRFLVSILPSGDRCDGVRWGNGGSGCCDETYFLFKLEATRKRRNACSNKVTVPTSFAPHVLLDNPILQGTPRNVQGFLDCPVAIRFRKTTPQWSSALEPRRWRFELCSAPRDCTYRLHVHRTTVKRALRSILKRLLASSDVHLLRCSMSFRDGRRSRRRQ